MCNALFDEPYLSPGEWHQGLILHAVYHRPNGWCAGAGEACMWGDYHAREAGLYLLRVADEGKYLRFLGVTACVVLYARCAHKLV